MLTLQTTDDIRDCEGVSRRDFIRAGAIGLGGLTLPAFLQAKAQAVAGGKHYVRDKAVVMLYLSGGASHIETFNPNMDAPAPYHSMTGEVRTSLPGVTFGGTFPQLAKRAHRMAVVRSFRHPIGGHQQAHVHVLSGGTDPKGDATQGFSIGSLYARIRGTNSEATGLPTYSLLTHKEIDGQYSKELGRVRLGSTPRELGPVYAPFEHHDETYLPKGKSSSKRRSRSSSRDDKGSIAADMRLSIPADRFDDRKALLAQLDNIRREIDRSGQLEAAGKYQQQAFELVTGAGAKAFDIAGEPANLVARYDTSDTLIGKKVFRPSNLGKQMLMARRLVEAGCGFVTVHSAGWDMHADGNNPGMVAGMNMLGNSLDKAVAAFMDDVKSRGLDDKILLVITGDFGRTPKINGKGGRDHWANLGTLAFAGGGLPMGMTIGQSDRRNGEPATDPVTPRMMMGTIMRTLFDVGELRLDSGLPRDVSETAQAEGIRELG